MTKNILGQLAKEKRRVVPANTLHFLVSRIAQRLKDTENLTRYLVLAEHYPEELLLKAYQSSRSLGSSGAGFFAFFQELT